jgi:hypothetical protein
MAAIKKRHLHCTVARRPMPYSLSKSVLACLLGALVLFVPRGAAAQSGTGGTISSAAALATSDFTFFLESYDKDQKQWSQMNSTTQQFFFNRARCECDDDTTNWSGYFKIAIQPASTTSTKVAALLTQNLVSSGRAAIFAGGNATNCLDPNQALTATSCLNLIEPGNQAAGIEGGITAVANPRVWESNPIPAAWLFNSTTQPLCTSAAACDSKANCATASALTATIYVWVQTTALQTPDLSNLSFNVNLVGEISFAPTNVTVGGGNEALAVKWDWPVDLNPAANPTFMGTQVFCVRAADLQVFKPNPFGPGFMTSSGPQGICQNVAPASSATGIFGLDPDYLCSGLLPSTSNSYRIEGLQNGINYGVGVAAIDKYQNASVISDLVYAMPIPTVDFYTEYKNDGGASQGGYCAAASGQRSPGLLALGGFVALGLLWWRRRKGRGPGAGPLAVVLISSALASGQARAQAVYHDDSIIEDHATEAWKGTPREFAIEARFGLYTPGVDSEFSGTGVKPQSHIFGSQKRPMWQFEFDWELLQAFGTLSLGGVVGYYKENALAPCAASILQADPSQCDSSGRSGDNTSLRLIPLAALVIYRLDVAAEQWKIPLVPYGKVGLNYTIWTVNDGNGNVPYAGGGRGQGGTAGWQAAVGISLQLDWLDPSAARGFDADAGVNHSYAFFELDTIQSSGLGSSNKLHVGDNTWFAGLMFEF